MQPEFDLTYGMFYAGMWGSNTDFGDSIEIDYYAGITPKWRELSPSTSPASSTPIRAFNGEIDYFELKTGATWTGGSLDPRRHQLLVAG